ncbi:MAG: hypothetical protein D3904_05275 [Candidatus Electrothrix sp. EH2]|nr:hypothetical protein [Candidatus Electrothrix sp. EH2]
MILIFSLSMLVEESRVTSFDFCRNQSNSILIFSQQEARGERVRFAFYRLLVVFFWLPSWSLGALIR